MVILQKIYGLVGKRAIVLIAAVAILSHFLVNMDRMRMKTINNVVPGAPLGELTAFSKNPSIGPNPVLEQYVLYFRTLANLLPKFSVAYGMAGYCYYYLGDTDKAISAYRQAIRFNPQFFWFYYNLGLIYYQQGKYDQAAGIFKKAIATHPDDAMLFMNTARIYIDLTKDALKSDHAIKQLLAGYRNAYELLVLCDIHLKEYKEVLYIIENSSRLGLHTKDIIYYYSGWAYFGMKDYQQASIHLQKAVKENPQMKEIYYYLACSFKELGIDVQETGRVCGSLAQPVGYGPFEHKQYNVAIF